MTRETPTPWAQHELIANELRASIFDGTYPVGTAIPSTRELRARFGAAPQTLNSATSTLAAEGLVRSERGRGIIVLPHQRHLLEPAASKNPVAPGQPFSWLTNAEAEGLAARIDVLGVTTVRPPADVQAAFGNQDEAVVRSQLLFLNDRPAELVTAYYPTAIAVGTALVEPKRIKGGSPRLLTDLGHRPEQWVDDVTAALPTGEQVRLLRMVTREPLLRTLRTVATAGGRVVEVLEVLKPGTRAGSRYRF
jgi:GntR family transcriptional regulator